MKYDFDELVKRRGTGCVKWDESKYPDVIPLWVADMDFKAAPAILEAVQKREPSMGCSAIPLWRMITMSL